MSQAAVEPPSVIDVIDYFDGDSDDSDESTAGSPQRQDSGEVRADVPDCDSSKSSSGVSEDSFSSPDSKNLGPSKPQRRSAATRISLSDRNNFEIVARSPFLTEEELLDDDDDDEFFNGSIDSDEEKRLLSRGDSEKKEEDDLGFHEVSPLKRERVGTFGSESDVFAKRPRLEEKIEEFLNEKEEEVVQEEVVEDVRDSSAQSDGSPFGLDSFVVLQQEPKKRASDLDTVSIHESINDEEDEDSFDVAGVQWNFSSRTAEYLTSAEFIEDIYRVICDRERGCEITVMEERPADIDDALRKEFIDMLLSRKEHLKISLTSVHLSVRLLDAFIRDHSCDRRAFIGVCICAVALASKLEEYDSCRFSDVSRMIFPFEGEMEVKKLKGIEAMIYSVLNHNIDVPTPFLVANIFHTVVVSTKQQVHLANYLLELCLMDWSLSQHRPTVIAHAAVSLSHALAKVAVDGDSQKFLSSVDSLGSVEGHLAAFTPMEDTRPIAAILLQLFETASKEAPNIYDRYSTENELYVALFGIPPSLQQALSTPTSTLSHGMM